MEISGAFAPCVGTIPSIEFIKTDGGGVGVCFRKSQDRRGGRRSAAKSHGHTLSDADATQKLTGCVIEQRLCRSELLRSKNGQTARPVLSSGQKARRGNCGRQASSSSLPPADPTSWLRFVKRGVLKRREADALNSCERGRLYRSKPAGFSGDPRPLTTFGTFAFER